MTSYVWKRERKKIEEIERMCKREGERLKGRDKYLKNETETEREREKERENVCVCV